MGTNGRTTRDIARQGLAAVSAAIIIGAGLLLTTTSATAGSRDDIGCMQNVAGFSLNCNSNDVRVAGVARNADGSFMLRIDDDGCAFPGDTVDFTATFDVLLNAQARYDLGIYFALDGDPNGDGALTGRCMASTIDSSSNAEYVQLDTGGDTCGDINSARNPLKPTISLRGVVCVDRNNDQLLDFPNCVSWRQPGSNELCTDPRHAFPGSPSKCKCDAGFTVPIDVPSASIQVTKTPNVTSVNEPGASVTYVVTVRNLGIDPANTVAIASLVDNRFGNLSGQGTCNSTANRYPTALASGATYTCSFSGFVGTNVSHSPHVNRVTASGTDARGNSVSGNATASVNILGVAPTIQVTKTANPTQLAEPGGSVSYTVSVRNTSVSTDPIRILSLADDRFGNLSGQGTCNTAANPYPTALAPGATYSCVFTRTISGNYGYVHTNIVTASIVDDDGQNGGGQASATVTITNTPSMIEVTKTPSPASLPEPGGNVTYTITVRNTSTVDTVTISSLTDDRFGNLNGQGTCAVPFTRAPGASYSCSFTRSLTGNGGQSHVNTVTASGLDDDNEAVTDSGSATVNFTDVLPAATLSKSVDSMLVTYRITVANDSTAEEVYLIALVDDRFGNLLDTSNTNVSANTCQARTLAKKGQSGDTYSCTFKAVVSSSPHTNRATATVKDDENNSVQPDPTDTATVSFQ